MVWHVPVVASEHACPVTGVWELSSSLSSPSVLNKCFVSVPSLLFITNKYLSTESLAPRCLTVISYFCHLLVLFLSPPLTAALPRVTECCGALQLSSVLGGVGSWCPRAKPPWVVSHILCPHLRPHSHKPETLSSKGCNFLKKSALPVPASFAHFSFHITLKNIHKGIIDV